MKKLITRLTAFIFALAVTVSVCPLTFAESVVTAGDITYVIDGNNATVHKYVGKGGAVNIPSKINGVPITAIGNYAFAEEYGKTEQSKRITSVTVSANIKSIGNGAFMECTSLKSIELPASLEVLGDAVFWYCESLESVVAFPSVKTIGANVFGKCPKVKVYCEAGSVIEKYAKSNGVATKSLYPASVSTNKTSITLNKGGSVKLTASSKPADCYYKDVIWLSNNSSVASVDQTGKVTANKYGKAKIQCKSLFGNAQAYVNISVDVPKVSSITCEDRTLTGYKIKWKKVKGADGYRLQKYVNSQWKTVKTTTKTSYTFKNLEENSSCQYRVRAYVKQDSGKVWGKWSEILTASTKSVKKVKGLKVSSCTSTSVKIKWNKQEDADGYVVYCYNTKTKKYEKIKTTTKTSFTHSDLSAGQQKKYKVRAYMKVDKKKHYGKYSSVLTVYTAPAKVKNVKSGGATKDTLTVKWSKVKNANGYQLQLTAGDFKKTVTTTKTSYTVSGLSKNTKYTVKVRAYITYSNKKYYGAYSQKVTLSTNYVPTSVTDITAEFNEAFSKTANSAKLYASKTETTSIRLTQSNITDRYTVNTVSALVNEYNTATVTTADFEKGKERTTKISTQSFFIPSGKVQTIPASAVKKASFKKDGSGYTVTLELKSESVKNNALPQNTSKIAPTINWKNVTAYVSDDADITSTSTSYTGTTVKGKINQFGKFDTLTISVPFTANINGTVNSKKCEMTVQGKKNLEYVITWW